jgi:ribose transport system permease protein
MPDEDGLSTVEGKTVQPDPAPGGREDEAPATGSAWRSRVTGAGLLNNYAAVGVLLLFIIGFSIARPHQFPTLGNFKTIVFTESVLALLSLGVVAPLVVGEFDLSVGSALSFGAVVSAELISGGTSVPVTILLVLLMGLAIGLINAALIVRLEVSSFIATLGTGILLDGLTLWVSGGQTIYNGIGPSFTQLGRNTIFGVLPLPGLYVIVAAGIIWYVLENTPLGREMYVTGYGRNAARLAGIRVERRIVLAFVMSGVVAALSGLIQAANLGSASPGIGAAFLLPAFAAAFLGSTTIKAGRFNVGGTLVAAVLLAVGITGLELMGAQPYVQQFFYGGALIVSVAFAQAGVRRLRARKADSR